MWNFKKFPGIISQPLEQEGTTPLAPASNMTFGSAHGDYIPDVMSPKVLHTSTLLAWSTLEGSNEFTG